MEKAEVNLKIILLTILLIGFIFLLCYVYQSMPHESRTLESSGDMIKYADLNLKDQEDYENLMLPDLRYRDKKISYFINESCDENKVKAMLSAFEILENSTEILEFYEGLNENESEILISCPNGTHQIDEMNSIAGLGGITSFLNSTFYPIILKSKVELYEDKKEKCSKPVVEIHELLHAFGFRHTNYTRDIMYPYVECKSNISSAIIEKLKQLYSLESLPDLAVYNLTVKTRENYLNLTIYVKNMGFVDSNNSTIKIYIDNREIERADIGTLDIGASKMFSLTNARFSPKNSKELVVEINYEEKELNKENNFLNLNLTI